MLLRERPELIDRSFERDEDKLSAAFAAAIVPWANSRRPMERFYLMTGMIEAALDNWQTVKNALVEYGLAGEILDAMVTPVRAQRIADDGRSLVGEVNGRAHQRPRLGRPSDRRSVLHAPGGPLLAVLRRQ